VAVDAREFIIPDKLVLAGVLLGLTDAALANSKATDHRSSPSWPALARQTQSSARAVSRTA